MLVLLNVCMILFLSIIPATFLTAPLEMGQVFHGKIQEDEKTLNKNPKQSRSCTY